MDCPELSSNPHIQTPSTHTHTHRHISNSHIVQQDEQNLTMSNAKPPMTHCWAHAFVEMIPGTKTRKNDKADGLKRKGQDLAIHNKPGYARDLSEIPAANTQEYFNSAGHNSVYTEQLWRLRR